MSAIAPSQLPVNDFLKSLPVPIRQPVLTLDNLFRKLFKDVFYSSKYLHLVNVLGVVYEKQEAFVKCWAHSPLRAAARRIVIHQVSLPSRRTPPAHRCLQRRRQRVTEGTAMAPWNGAQLSYRYLDPLRRASYVTSQYSNATSLGE